MQNKTTYKLNLDPIDIPSDAIDLFKVNGQWSTNNPKAIDWMVKQLQAKATCLTIDITNK